MTVTRGDVVLLDYPFASGTGGKVRPALVVQNDKDNGRLLNTIVVMITSRTHRAAQEPTQLLIDISTSDGRQSGLIMNSAVSCANLFTVGRNKIIRSLGHLTPALMAKVDLCLKAVLAVA